MRVAAHRQHPAPLALGDEAVLQDRLVAAPSGPPCARASADARRATRRAARAGAGSRGRRACRRARSCPVISSARSSSVGSVEHASKSAGSVGPPRREEAPQRARRPEQAPDARAARPATRTPPDARALDRLAHVVHLAGRQRPPLARAAASPRRPAPASARASSRVSAKGRRARELPAERARAAVGEGGEHAVPLEVGAGLRRAGVERAAVPRRAGRIAPPDRTFDGPSVFNPMSDGLGRGPLRPREARRHARLRRALRALRDAALRLPAGRSCRPAPTRRTSSTRLCSPRSRATRSSSTGAASGPGSTASPATSSSTAPARAGRGENAHGQARASATSRPPPPTSASPHGELLRALDGAVARLPSPLSEVYHLRSSGLSYEEMAIVLGIPLGTLKSRMNQMVNVLREELKPWTAR